MLVEKDLWVVSDISAGELIGFAPVDPTVVPAA